MVGGSVLVSPDFRKILGEFAHRLLHFGRVFQQAIRALHLVQLLEQPPRQLGIQLVPAGVQSFRCWRRRVVGTWDRRLVKIRPPGKGRRSAFRFDWWRVPRAMPGWPLQLQAALCRCFRVSAIRA